MRDDIIKLVAGQKNLTHVLITTFNIDFIFIESVLLRELRKCGHPSLTILADADEVVTTFSSQGRWVSRIGRRYRVVPIRMGPGFRFHPKVVVLAGTERAEVLIGSGNLTFGGMRQNDEAWLRFDTDRDGTGALASARVFADACLDRAPFPGPVRAELRDAFDGELHAWSRSLDPPSGMIARVGAGPTLLNQMIGTVGGLDVRRIVVGSPYFDEEGGALGAIATQWPGVPIEVLVQSGQSQLLDSAWSRIREPKSLVSVATSRGEEARAFIHAKFYAFIGGSESVVFVGSANCSHAALTIPGPGGNAEAMAITRVNSSAINDVLMAGVRVVDEPAVLTAAPVVLLPAEPLPAVRIHGAHHDHGELVVVFVAPPRAQALELSVDGRALADQDFQVTDGVLRAKGIGVVNRVRLAASVDGSRVVSAEHWVDHEFLLSATSRQRQAAQAIGDHVSPGQWSFVGWTEVLRLLGDHLRHTPEGSAHREQQEAEHRDKPQSTAASDFFTDDYSLPQRRHEVGRLDEAARVLGLRGLLLDYFGVSNDETAEVPPEHDDNDDDAVDRQEAAKTKQRAEPRPRPKRNLTDAERRRGQRISKQIVDVCTSKAFIETRPGAMLASDLAIVAVLLVSGHAEQWLKSEDFLDLTYRVWYFLGALARRHDPSASPRQFEDSIRSVRLAAALATWCFSCPLDVSHAEATRYEVATRLAVARLPWMWHLEARELVERELFEIAQRTGWLGSDVTDRWSEVLSRWDCLFAEGRAIAAFEKAVLQQDMSTLRGRVTDDGVPAGTLLWQGPKLGFCTLAQTAKRLSRSDQAVPVLTLRSQNRDTKLSPPYLLPFRSLLRLAADSSPLHFTEAHAQALAAFATRIESMWVSKR
jgi:hypothetical protein